MLYRIRGAQSGFWEVPSGHIKEDEDEETAAIREVREETGLEVENLEKFGINIDDSLGFKTGMYKTEKFFGTTKNKDTKNHSEVSWFELNNLPSHLGLTTKKGLKILKDFGSKT